MSAGSSLADVLRPLLPKTWRVQGYENDIDGLRAPMVQCFQNRLQKSPQAPLSLQDHTLIVRVISPVTDPAKRDDALEEALITTLTALESSTKNGTKIRWSDATAALFSDYPSYDIQTTLTTEHHYGRTG